MGQHFEDVGYKQLEGPSWPKEQIEGGRERTANLAPNSSLVWPCEAESVDIRQWMMLGGLTYET
jgi:hypothetical protein